jgi:5-methylcytosine-specific restriction endonuclease McrA
MLPPRVPLLDNSRGLKPPRTPRLSDKSGYRWAKLRECVLREEPLCRVCEAAKRVTRSTECDHILPLEQGGTDARENLQGICGPCHRDKTARERGHKQSNRPRIGLDGYPVKS